MVEMIDIFEHLLRVLWNVPNLDLKRSSEALARRENRRPYEVLETSIS